MRDVGTSSSLTPVLPPHTYLLYSTYLPASLNTPARHHAHSSAPPLIHSCSRPARPTLSTRLLACSLSCSTRSTPRPLARVVHVPSAHRLHCPDPHSTRPDSLLDAMGTRVLECSPRSTVDPASALVPSGSRARFRLRLISVHARLLDTTHARLLVLSNPSTFTPSKPQLSTARGSHPAPPSRIRNGCSGETSWEEVGNGQRGHSRCELVEQAGTSSSLVPVSPSPGHVYPPPSSCLSATPAYPFSATPSSLLDALRRHTFVLPDDHTHNPFNTRPSLPRATHVRYIAPTSDLHQPPQWHARTHARTLPRRSAPPPPCVLDPLEHQTLPRAHASSRRQASTAEIPTSLRRRCRSMRPRFHRTYTPLSGTEDRERHATRA